jgi:hypothetical protein
LSAEPSVKNKDVFSLRSAAFMVIPFTNSRCRIASVCVERAVHCRVIDGVKNEPHSSFIQIQDEKKTARLKEQYG